MKDNFQEFFSDSILKFESMIKSNKFLFFDLDEFESIIIYYLESGNSSMANKAIKMAVDQYPNNTSILLLKVEALIFENKIEEAEKIIDLLFEFETNNSEIIIQKSRILSKRKKHTDSISLLKKIKKDCEFYSDALIMIGKEYLFIDDFENAKEKFKEYINDYQLDYAVLNNLLYCYDAIGNTDSTINYLNDFLEINPYCEVAWHQLGKQYLKKELYKEAITAFDFAIISDDSFVGAYLEMGKEKFESYNDYPESAKNAAKRALEWRDAHPDQDCGTAVGWTRANQLAKGENISEETIARMASFARHLQYKDVAYSEGCGGLMVDAWGGQAGIEWASNKLKEIRSRLIKIKEQKRRKKADESLFKQQKKVERTVHRKEFLGKIILKVKGLFRRKQ